MCRSLEDGGRRCRCTTPEAAAEKRRKRNDAQKRYLKRKAAASVVEPENPFTDFTITDEPLTAEERAEEKSRLDDFFARKLADPSAQWDAAPVSDDVDENPFAGWVTGQPILER